MSLAALQQRPELLKPPESVLSRIAYRGRGVALCGPDKSGKSTLMRHATTAITLGRSFLGGPTQVGRVVLLGLEEAVGDAVRHLTGLGADPDRVQILTLSPPDVLERTSDLLGRWPADLVIVDSLQEYARVTRGSAPEDGNNAGWGDVVRPLVRLARDHDVAVVALHHVRRSDGEFRGPGEIAAAVDAIFVLAMPNTADDLTTRRIRGRGRWAIEPFTVALRDGHYELASGGELSVDALVLLWVERHPGASKRSVREGVKRRGTAVDAAINRLVNRGAIEDRGSGDRMLLHMPSGQLSTEFGDGA